MNGLSYNSISLHLNRVRSRTFCCKNWQPAIVRTLITSVDPFGVPYMTWTSCFSCLYVAFSFTKNNTDDSWRTNDYGETPQAAELLSLTSLQSYETGTVMQHSKNPSVIALLNNISREKGELPRIRLCWPSFKA